MTPEALAPAGPSRVMPVNAMAALGDIVNTRARSEMEALRSRSQSQRAIQDERKIQMQAVKHSRRTNLSAVRPDITTQSRGVQIHKTMDSSTSLQQPSTVCKYSSPSEPSERSVELGSRTSVHDRIRQLKVNTLDTLVYRLADRHVHRYIHSRLHRHVYRHAHAYAWACAWTCVSTCVSTSA